MQFKLFFFLLFFCSLMGFSQSYDFDYMLHSKNIRENSKYNHEKHDMVNSKNHTYYMEVSTNTETKKLYAILLDYEGKEILRYDMGRRFRKPYQFFLEGNYKMKAKETYVPYDELSIQRLDELSYEIYGKQLGKVLFQISFKLQPHEADLLIFNYEFLQKEQMDEIENLLKNTLKNDGKEGNFFIKEMTYKSSKNWTMTSTITPEKL